MNNKGITAAIVIIVVVAIIGVYSAAQSTDSNNEIFNMSNNTSQNVFEQNIAVNNSTNSMNSTDNININNTTIVSAQQAKQIAQAYILDSSSETDNPTIVTWSDGKLVWNVPVISSDGQKEGFSIYIDAQTGARLR